MVNRWRLGACFFVASMAITQAARAQWLPETPITFGDGRVTISGAASAGISSNRDDPGWFNYTDYEHNTLRLIRLGFSAAVRANDHVAVLGEFRTENWDALLPYALYVRVRPWSLKPFDVQAGRIPPTFGAFARRAYETDNPLIGYPLAYQYLTTLRPDALPANADQLLEMRGNGWLVAYHVGSSVADAGLPLVNAFRWDTGVQVRLGSDPVAFSAAITTGTLSDPRIGDDNDAPQFAVRLAYRPSAGWVLGISGAHGPYLTNALGSALPVGTPVTTFVQRAVGADAEYSRGHWLIRGEAVLTDWNTPRGDAPVLPGRLRAAAVWGEGKVTILPGLYVAARLDHLMFSEITGSDGRMPWDAPVSRFEIGGGYSLRRNLVAKLAYQYNHRDGGDVDTLGIVAAQLQYWF